MVYLIINKARTLCKVGYSSNPKSRLSTLQTGNPEELYLEATLFGTRFLEKELHSRLSVFKVKNEWYIYSEAFINTINSAPINFFYRKGGYCFLNGIPIEEKDYNLLENPKKTPHNSTAIKNFSNKRLEYKIKV